MGKEMDAVYTTMAGAIKEMTLALLENYISDDRNYAVDGAVISCDQMCEDSVVLKCENGKLKMRVAGAEISKEITEGEYEEGYKETYDAGEEIIRTLSAVHATNQTSNGLVFATVSDCICLRDKEEKGLEDEASMISTGNCKILRESDISDIESRKEKAKIFGTCYCLMKPIIEWTNPICMEEVIGIHEEDFTTAGVSKVLDIPLICSVQEHHKTMEWDTENGKKEGLTRFSKLLCTRGGVIHIKWSGQTQDGNDIYKGYMSIDEFKSRYEQFITDLINKYGIQMTTEQIGKIVYVESSGTGFDAMGRMLIRFEVHHFFRYIDPSKLEEAKKYFDSPNGDWRDHKIKYGNQFVDLHNNYTINESDLQYLALQYARKIDEEAAYKSISMGLCQIMGSNYRTAGFSSAEEMYDAMSDGYEVQIEAMINHIKETGLDQGTITEFIKGYNGPGNVSAYKKMYDDAVW